MNRENLRAYFSLFAILIFSASFLTLSVASTLAPTVICAICLSMAGFACMGFDKSLARSQSRRVPEIVLLTIALLGGSPGVFFGVHFFKHKTRKAYFQFILLLIFCVQLYIMRILEISIF
jgi:uncharacterized membrane protein YsdA (DUF1294 family)